MADIIDLQQLLRVQHVPVVQAVDLAGLEGLLKQLIQRQKDANDTIQRQQAEIDALKAAQADQSQAPPGTDHDGTKATEMATALENLKDQLGALDRRLVDLEHTASAFPAADHATQQDGPAADTDSVQHSIQSTPSAAADSASTHIPAAGAQQGLGLSPADLQDIQRQQEQLARQLADVAAAQTGLQQQVSVLQDSKADRGDVRNMLSEGLQGKVDVAAVSQLKAQLGDKADRSELDALMNAMSASGSAFSPEDASSPAGAETGSTSHADTAAAQDPATDTAGVGSTPNGSTSDQAAAQAGDAAAAGSGSGLSPSRRGTREVAGGGDVGQQLSKLQLQVALLQDRVNKKADSQAVSDLSDGLSSTNNTVSGLEKGMQDLQQQLTDAHRGLIALQDSLGCHAADTGMHAGAGQRSTADLILMPAQGSPAAAGSDAQHSKSIDLRSLGQDQPQQPTDWPALTAKVAALEAGLQGLQAALSAFQQQQQQPQAQARRVSGEMPASSRLVQALAAQLGDLGAQVAELAARAGVPRVSGGGSASVQPAGATTDPTAAAAAQDTASDSAAAAPPAMAYPGAGAAAAGFGAPGGASGFSAELAAELDGRLSDLEALVQELSVVKGDQAGLQELRVLLADTATQADVDQLRNRLTSQQSLLDRLARQLSSGSSTSTGPNRGSRPQSAAGHHHSFAGAAPGSEVSLWGGADVTAAGGVDRHGELQAAGPGSDIGAFGSGSDQDATLGGMLAQLQAHQQSLEQLAEAVSLLATGQAAPAAAAPSAGLARGARGPLGALQIDSEGVDLSAGRFGAGGDGSVPATPSLQFQKGPSSQLAAAGGASTGSARPGTPLGGAAAGRIGGSQHTAAADGGAWDGGAWDSRQGVQQQSAAAALGAGPGPQVVRLKRLLQTGQVGRKMDWFDPTLLQKMAQRLAAVDAMLRNGADSGAGGVSPDLESKLRRLATDVRHLKDRMAELTAGGTGSGQGGLRALDQTTDGDHSMLSGKPLGGYRCMACDRPLSTLDARPGPHLPTGQLPVSLASGAELMATAGAALGKLPPASSSGRRATAEAGAAGAVLPSDPLIASSPDASKRLVGPQNWYTAVHGLPAEQLPKADVGPHLPPGGWRGTQPLKGDDAGSVLPSVRGGSTASGMGGTPRGGAAGVGDRGASSGGGR